MAIFALDIDNTIMHTGNKSGQDIVVETRKSGHQGCMFPEMVSALKCACKNNVFAVVTARSEKQFRRINFPSGAMPKIAFIANGALILEWDEKTQAYSKKPHPRKVNCQSFLSNIYNLIAQDNRFDYVKIVEDSFVFARVFKSGVKLPADDFDFNGFTFRQDKRRAYFFPEWLTKDIAIEVLREKFPSEKILCAGDSINDLTMLASADVSIYPYGDSANSATLAHNNSLIKICPRNINYEKFVASEINELLLD